MDEFFRVTTKSLFEQLFCPHRSYFHSREHWCSDCGMPMIKIVKNMPSPYSERGRHDEISYHPDWSKRLFRSHTSFLDIIRNEE